MNENEKKTVKSRRGRPAKTELSREAIVGTALALMDREGLGGLSLRAVAKELDTGAASLYVYLKNLDELHALMLDEALGEVKLEAAGGDWRARLKGLLKAYFEVLYRRRGVAQLALSTIATGPNALRLWESVLGLMKEGGVERQRAAWGLDLLMLYVTAVAAEQTNWKASGGSHGRVGVALEGVSPREFPLVFDFREEMISGGGDERQDWALDVLIDGIVDGRNPASMTRRGRAGAKRQRV